MSKLVLLCLEVCVCYLRDASQWKVLAPHIRNAHSRGAKSWDVIAEDSIPLSFIFNGLYVSDDLINRR